jgi:hypothetical protein
MHEQFAIVVNKVDESFSIQDTRNYGLAIQFSDTAFSYCILDFRHNKFLVLHKVKRNDFPSATALNAPKPAIGDFLNSVFSAMPWLKNPYKAVKIAYEGRKSTLIPGPLFDAGQIDKYLQFNFDLNPDERIFSDHLAQMDNHNVFTIPGVLADAMKVHFPAIRPVHVTSVLIESIWANFKNRINAGRVFIHMREKYFDLMIYDGRQMSYFNTFPYQNAEDVVYYLVFVMEQLNFNPEEIHTVLLGQVERASHLYELLAKYVRHVEFVRRNDAFKYSYLFNQVPSQSCYPLLNFFACEL